MIVIDPPDDAPTRQAHATEFIPGYAGPPNSPTIYGPAVAHLFPRNDSWRIKEYHPPSGSWDGRHPQGVEEMAAGRGGTRHRASRGSSTHCRDFRQAEGPSCPDLGGWARPKYTFCNGKRSPRSCILPARHRNVGQKEKAPGRRRQLFFRGMTSPCRRDLGVGLRVNDACRSIFGPGRGLGLEALVARMGRRITIGCSPPFSADKTFFMKTPGVPHAAWFDANIPLCCRSEQVFPQPPNTPTP